MIRSSDRTRHKAGGWLRSFMMTARPPRSLRCPMHPCHLGETPGQQHNVVVEEGDQVGGGCAKGDVPLWCEPRERPAHPR